jgi:hypothetical protein
VEAEEAAVEDTTTDDMTMAVTQVTVEREQLKYSFNITLLFYCPSNQQV